MLYFLNFKIGKSEIKQGEEKVQSKLFKNQCDMLVKLNIVNSS